MDPIVRDVLTFGGLLGVLAAVWKLFDRFRQEGADKQKMRDQIEQLQKDIVHRRETDARILGKLDHLEECFHSMEKKMIESLGNVDKRISVIEKTGCEPIKK